MTIDELAQEIRRVDGNNDMGAGALAEALMPFIERQMTAVDPGGCAPPVYVSAEARKEIAPGVRVKPLEWLDTGSGYYAHAELCQRFYSIGAEEGKFWANWDASIPPFTTPEAAKAAAQADYEGRIRAALEVGEETRALSTHMRGAIRQLRWDDKRVNHQALGPFGFIWYVTKSSDFDGYTAGRLGDFDTLSEAKSAVQAHFEKGILAAFEDTPLQSNERRSTHHVHRGPESLPCYCGASSDHSIGQEIPHD